MSNFTATVPIAQMAAANAALETQGFGPGNFSVPVYGATGITHAILHCWQDATFQAAVALLPGVVVTVPGGLIPSEPTALVTAATTLVSGVWAGNITPLPSTGTVTAGKKYSYGEEVWAIIQTFNRSTYGAAPSTYPALMRQIRNPNTSGPWKQPIDQFDAYKLVNPFTGKPDTCTYNGFTWKVTQADGSGNNVWTPGAFGWTKV